MTIFYMELKKIWNLPTVILLLGLMLINFNSKNKWSEELNTETYTRLGLMMELTEAVGTTLEEDELPQVKEIHAQLQRELDKIIKNHPDYHTNQVKDFATFKYNEDLSYLFPAPDNGEALGAYMYENHVDLLRKELCLEDAIESYEKKVANPEVNIFSFNTTEAEKELAQTQWDEGKGRSLFPSDLEIVTQFSFHYHFFHTILYVFLLLLPTIVRDRKNNIRELQWSSATGRDILKKQFLAHWVSTLAILLPSPFLFLYYFDTEMVRYYWNHSMLFFDQGFGYLLDFTYIQLLFCYFLFAFVLGLMLSGLIFLLSRFSKNYPSLLLKGMPLLYLIYALDSAWTRLFSINARIIFRYYFSWSPWKEVYLLLLAVLILGIVTYFTFRNDQTCDLLEN